MNKDLADRFDAIEIRLAYQDETIETLNKTITTQWTEIDRLKREMTRLSDRVLEAENRAGSAMQPDAPPPHY
jgi:SlyX protein